MPTPSPLLLKLCSSGTSLPLFPWGSWGGGSQREVIGGGSPAATSPAPPPLLTRVSPLARFAFLLMGSLEDLRGSSAQRLALRLPGGFIHLSPGPDPGSPSETAMSSSPTTTSSVELRSRGGGQTLPPQGFLTWPFLGGEGFAAPQRSHRNSFPGCAAVPQRPPAIWRLPRSGEEGGTQLDFLLRNPDRQAQQAHRIRTASSRRRPNGGGQEGPVKGHRAPPPTEANERRRSPPGRLTSRSARGSFGRSRKPQKQAGASEDGEPLGGPPEKAPHRPGAAAEQKEAAQGKQRRGRRARPRARFARRLARQREPRAHPLSSGPGAGARAEGGPRGKAPRRGSARGTQQRRRKCSPGPARPDQQRPQRGSFPRLLPQQPSWRRGEAAGRAARVTSGCSGDSSPFAVGGMRPAPAPSPFPLPLPTGRREPLRIRGASRRPPLMARADLPQAERRRRRPPPVWCQHSRCQAARHPGDTCWTSCVASPGRRGRPEPLQAPSCTPLPPSPGPGSAGQPRRRRPEASGPLPGRRGRGLRGLQQQDALVPSAEAAGTGWVWSDLMGQPGSLQLQASAPHQPGHSGWPTLQGCC